MVFCERWTLTETAKIKTKKGDADNEKGFEQGFL
jgi:hypothetical protein